MELHFRDDLSSHRPICGQGRPREAKIRNYLNFGIRFHSVDLDLGSPSKPPTISFDQSVCVFRLALAFRVVLLCHFRVEVLAPNPLRYGVGLPLPPNFRN